MATKNSLILKRILLIPEKIHIGVMKVVSKIKSIEIPSTPNLNLNKPLIQFLSSRNWKSEVELSKEYHKKIDKKKFTSDTKIAKYFEFCSAISFDPLVKRMKILPISGRKVMDDKIGKFIILNKLIIMINQST